MNWFLVFIVVLLIVNTIHGYRRGFIRVAFSLVSVILTIMLVSVLSPYISDFMENHTPVYSKIREVCDDTLKESFDSKNIDETNGEQQNEWLESFWIPKEAKQILESNNDINNYTALQASGFTEYVGNYIAKLIMNAISFLVTFLIITFILRITVFTLDSVAKLPILNGVNKAAGLVVGFAQGLIVVWIIFIAVIIFFKTDLGAYLLGEIQRNYFLDWLYNNNYLLKCINVIMH